MNHKTNTQDFFSRGTFVVPEDQRTYKWSIKENKEKESALEYFFQSLKITFNHGLQEYFIEAVTLVDFHQDSNT